MGEGFEYGQSAGGAGGRELRIPKKALNKLDDDTIVQAILRPNGAERPLSWWRRFWLWVTRNRSRWSAD
jgi:hypothetical protein